MQVPPSSRALLTCICFSLTWVVSFSPFRHVASKADIDAARDILESLAADGKAKLLTHGLSKKAKSAFGIEGIYICLRGKED